MIYFDNSATGGFKPSSSTEAAINAIKYLSANPGRSGHRLSVTGANIVYRAREELSTFFNLGFPERVIFTKNSTEALNLAILGSAKKGGHIITTVFEHNSVLRPVFHLEKEGVVAKTIVQPTKNSLFEEIKKAVTDKTYLVIVNHVSNVNGAENDIKKIGMFCKEKGLIFLVDAAQSAGHIQIDMEKLNISMLTIAGHKGMYGIMGSGALLFKPNIEIKPIMFGGTGTESFSPIQPQYYPEKLESGTLNLPAIASLLEGTFYVKKNVCTFGSLLESYSKTLIEELSALEKITLYSAPNKSGIVAFNIDGFSSEEVADILNKDYDIAVRGGLQCAPLMHKFLKTEKIGVVRASLAPQNSTRELYAFISAVKKIAES